MHDATYTFVDKDTLKTEWTHYVDGKPGGKVVFDSSERSERRVRYGRLRYIRCATGHVA